MSVFRGFLSFQDENPHVEVKHYLFPDRQPYAVAESVFNADGCVFWSDRDNSWPWELLNSGMPLVTIGADWIGIDRVLTITRNRPAYANIAITHLRQQGCKRIAYIGHELIKRRHGLVFHEMLTTAWNRYELSPVSFFETVGVHPDQDRTRISNVENQPALLAYLESLERGTGIVCEVDHIARMVCNAIHKIGRKVPEDLLILGYGNLYIGSNQSPGISTVHFDLQKIGKLALQTLYEHVQSGYPTTGCHFIDEPILIVRESTDISLRPMPQTDYLLEAKKLIETKADQGITVSGICSTLNVSKSKLSVDFLNRFGISPGVAIRRARLQKACQLLSQTQLSISAISDACGFEERHSFYNFFKRELGCSPREYRKSAH